MNALPDHLKKRLDFASRKESCSRSRLAHVVSNSPFRGHNRRSTTPFGKNKTQKPKLGSHIRKRRNAKHVRRTPRKVPASFPSFSPLALCTGVRKGQRSSGLVGDSWLAQQINRPVTPAPYSGFSSPVAVISSPVPSSSCSSSLAPFYNQNNGDLRGAVSSDADASLPLFDGSWYTLMELYGINAFGTNSE
ncbi:hypothetical protein QOT17_005792 [Balamuthia mandrillaris]